MTKEYTPLPPEYAPLPPEYTPPSLEITPPPQKQFHYSEPKGFAEKQATGAGKKIKVWAASALVAVAAVVSTELVPVIGPAAEYLEEYPLAYCVSDAAEAEARIEQELWYQLFGQTPQFEHTGPFFGTFSDRNAFEDAVKVEKPLYTGGSEILSLPYYKYTVELPERTFEGKIYVLPDENTAILRIRQQGVFRYWEITPVETVLTEAYDIIDGEPQVSAFGNGVDIAGFWEKSENQLKFHCTSEHTMGAGRTDLGIIVTLYNTPG